MEVINSADFFGTNIEVREDNFKSLLKKKAEQKYLGLKKETEEKYSENYDEPMYFFRGVFYGLLFCLPFWTILFWVIT